MGWNIGHMTKPENGYRILVEKPEVNRRLERP
jgi:hypothetical protein